MIDKEDLQAVCRQFQLDVSGPVLDDLMDYCDTDKDGLISFLEFSNFLNWKDKMPINSREQRILTNGQLNGLGCICLVTKRLSSYCSLKVDLLFENDFAPQSQFLCNNFPSGRKN